MFVYMLVGFVLYKKGLLTKEGTGSLSNLLVYVVMPCVILHSFCIPYTSDGPKILLEGLVAAVIALGIGAIVCALIYKNDVITKVGTTFPNAGFIGIPLVNAVFYDGAAFYMMPLQTLVASLQYTYAQVALSKEKQSIVKGLLTNPMIIAIVIGLFVYFLRLGELIPGVLLKAIDGLYATQSPLAMIIIGTYLAQIDFTHLHIKADLLASFVRLLLIPTLVFVALKFLPIDHTIKTVVLIASSCSIGSNIAVYAEKFGGDHVFACEVVTFTTVLSIVTLPIIMLVSVGVI